MSNSKTCVVTFVYGSHIHLLEKTFRSFEKQFAGHLYAFYLAEYTPDIPDYDWCQLVPRKSDPRWCNPMREVDYRRWQVLDELYQRGYDYALVVDGGDVIQLHPLPNISSILYNGYFAFAACREQVGQNLYGECGYIPDYLNAGVTFWHIGASINLREEILTRGRAQYRNNIDDQINLNEVVYTRYTGITRILPASYNFRAFLCGNSRKHGWPCVDSLAGVKIYHNGACINQVRNGYPYSKHAELKHLTHDLVAPDKWTQLFRRIKYKLKYKL